jgi:hypothetical protein
VLVRNLDRAPERQGPTLEEQRNAEFGTSVAFGVRWDFSQRVFLDASTGREWIDLDYADRPDFTQLRIAFGIHEDNGAAR